jgi:hypothetical protein
LWVRADLAHPFMLTGDAMKILLVAGIAVLSLLMASADNPGSPVKDEAFAWAAGIPLDSPK